MTQASIKRVAAALAETEAARMTPETAMESLSDEEALLFVVGLKIKAGLVAGSRSKPASVEEAEGKLAEFLRPSLLRVDPRKVPPK